MFRHSAGWGGVTSAGSAGGSGAGFSLANNYSGTLETKWSIYLDGSNDGLRFTANTPDQTSDEKLRIDATGRVLIGVNAATNSDSYVQAFKPTGNDATITVGNVATSASGLCRYDFAPSNKVVGARIECHATEDFSTSANRTADLVFITRKDGTLSEKLRITSAGHIQLQGGTIYGDDTAAPTFKLQSTNANNNHYSVIGFSLNIPLFSTAM